MFTEDKKPPEEEQKNDQGKEDRNRFDDGYNNPWMGSSWIWVLLVLGILFGSRFLFETDPNRAETIGLNELVQSIQSDNVAKIIVQGETVKVELRDGTEVHSRKESNESLFEMLAPLGIGSERLANIPVEIENPPNTNAIFSWLIMLLPMVLIFGFFIFIMRQAGSMGNNRAMQFGRSRARKLDNVDRPTITFDDVAGAEESKQELAEVVEFLKEPEKFAALGARIPKGVLMIGAPGTGKTLLAKAVAGEAGVPFFSSSGSEFVEMFVGVGASRVRDMFEEAKKNSPCIIFIDEIDAVGRHRGAGMGGGNDEREQTLNQILVEMDGFDSESNIVMIAATNRPDILDPALLRPGRFDRKVVVDRPDKRGREAILNVHARGKPLSPDVDLSVIAAQTPGMVGADLENLINEGAILAARRNQRVISMTELTESIERVMAGPARHSRVLTDEDRELIAYHEAGHALVMENLEYSDGVGKITIVSRGQALGYVMPLPEEERGLQNRAEFEDQIAGLLGGRAAEEIVFDETYTGAANDLERVTKMAKSMVTRYGMSDVLGPMQLQQGERNPFMGMELGERRPYSEDMARKIDQEVRAIVEQAHKRAQDILNSQRELLNLIAETLLEQEVLERKDFLQLIGKAA